MKVTSDGNNLTYNDTYYHIIWYPKFLFIYLNLIITIEWLQYLQKITIWLM